jgi:hypothetical protein
MFKHAVRNLTLALTLTAFFTPMVHADGTQTGTPPPVTGTDPEPTSPGVAQMIFVFLHLA